MEAIDRTIEVDVDGMTCSKCVAHINQALEELPHVKNVDVILRSARPSTATVISDVDLSDELLSQTIYDAGYEVVAVRRDLS